MSAVMAVIPMTDDAQAEDAAAKRQRLDALSARLHACAKRLLDGLAVRLHAWKDQMPVADDEDEPSDYPEYARWDVVPFVAWYMWGEPKFADYVHWLLFNPGAKFNTTNLARALASAAGMELMSPPRCDLKEALEKIIAKQQAGELPCTAIPQHVPESERIRGGVPDAEWVFMHYVANAEGDRMIAETRPGSEREFRRYAWIEFRRPGATEGEEPQRDEQREQDTQRPPEIGIIGDGLLIEEAREAELANEILRTYAIRDLVHKYGVRIKGFSLNNPKKTGKAVIKRLQHKMLKKYGEAKSKGGRAGAKRNF